MGKMYIMKDPCGDYDLVDDAFIVLWVEESHLIVQSVLIGEDYGGLCQIRGYMTLQRSKQLRSGLQSLWERLTRTSGWRWKQLTRTPQGGVLLRR